MNPRAIRTILAAAFLGLGALLAFPRGDGKPPQWWDIEVRLTTEGRYATTLGGTAYSGEYRLKETWWGSMEKDEDDYRLFHGRRETQEWGFRENAASGGLTKVLTEKDCPDRPSFRVNYVLKEDHVVRFFVVVENFEVPKGASGGGFELLMPRSRGDLPDPAASPYDGNVIKGSNDTVFDEGTIQAGPAKRVFRWEWKGYQPSPVPESAVVLWNTHQAEIRITVTPRNGSSTD